MEGMLKKAVQRLSEWKFRTVVGKNQLNRVGAGENDE